MHTRRGVVGLMLLAPLVSAGCGWEPLYADRESGPADTELQAIRVDPIPERIGQRLELALRRSLNPDGVAATRRYVLHTTLVVTRQDLGIQSQGLGTLGRVDVHATFTLTDVKTNATVLTSASHVFDTFDIVSNEYATVVAEEDARNRTVEELRRDMVTKLTLFMQRRVAGAA
jgi:LPS-assembly lipoprotein